MSDIANLPRISVNALNQQQLGVALRDSFHDWGFALIGGHGVAPALIDDAEHAARALFALPLREKMRYHRAGTLGVRGYTPLKVETAKGAQLADLKEFWHVGRELPAHHRYAGVLAPNLWPAELPEFRRPTQALYRALDQLGQRLLGALGLTLGLPGDWFEQRVASGNSILRLLHYPPVSGDSGHVRAGAHEDIDVITLLPAAAEAGLELRDPGGRWLAVNAPPGMIVVNVGDMLQRLSNDVLRSTSHRVVNPPSEDRGQSRYAMPFFLHFQPDVEIRSLPGCVTPDNPERYPQPITEMEYLQQRLREIKLG